MAKSIIFPGNTVFVRKTEQYWDKPYAMKAHHVYDTRSVLLRVVITEVEGKEFKATLLGNNTFEKDGETFTFNEGELLCEQNFTNFESLGKWSKP